MGGRAELVFIPCPSVGHLVSMVELAKLLVDREEGLSVAVLVMNLSGNSSLKAMVDSLSTAPSSALNRFIELPHPELHDASASLGFGNFLVHTIESYKPRIREAVLELGKNNSSRSDSPRLAGIVVDMFCATMMDVADDFKVPSYLFYTSSATFLGVMSHLQGLRDVHQQDIGMIIESDGTIDYQGFAKPFPAKFLPSEMMNKDLSSLFLGHVQRLKETKGIMANTFEEVDARAIKYVFDDKLPVLYTVGPLLNLKGTDADYDGSDDILKWLDDQPLASVVFLCFGSMGSFGEDQMRNIAEALDKSGHRFLWSLRRPPPVGKFDFASCYEDPAEVLPEGFLDRTARKGKVIGWAPQAQVLAHPSVGGFVSHCGWNSILESIWFGVPIAAWPMYAEQHSNAFALVEELDMAVEIRMDYRRDYMTGNEVIIPAEDIERGIRRLMETEREEKKEKMKEMSERSRKAIMEGGSSHLNLRRFIKDVFSNIKCSE